MWGRMHTPRFTQFPAHKQSAPKQAALRIGREHTHAPTHTYTYTHIHLHTHIHTYTHTPIQTHIHTYIFVIREQSSCKPLPR